MYGWAKKYVGIPFLSNGRDENGCDCYGLVRLILRKEYGYDLPSLSADYADALDIARTKEIFLKNAPVLCGEQIQQPEESSVALMRMHGSLCHIALYAGDGYIIHSRYKVGAVLERISSPYLTNCIKGWYRVSQSYGMSESVLNGKNGVLV